MKPASRWFWPAVVAMLCAMATLEILSMLGESQTYDEGFHITAGFSYWKTGDFRLNPEHPPLSKLLAAMPLLAAGAQWNPDPEQWKNSDIISLFGYFIYRNALDADRLLLLARLPTVLISVLLGVAIACFTRAHFGAAAGLTALFFYATDANFIAHGHYVTSDAIAALTIFVSAIAWLRALESDRPRDFAIAGFALGLALAAKFSTVFLLPVHVLAALWKRKLRFDACAIALAAAVAVVAAMYWPQTAAWNSLGPLAKEIPPGTKMSTALTQFATDYRLPNHGYLNGLVQVYSHEDSGHRTYLNGAVKERGTWLYFPEAFAVKTPSATLILAVLAIAASILRPGPLALYPAIYAALAVSSSLNIGLRHLLPVYPFLFVSIGRVFANRRWLIVAAAAVQLFELARVHPDYLASFNTLAGGPAKGHEYLLDSNLDWGQDAKKLGQWMRQNKVDEICLSYFGTASLDYYGVRQIPLIGMPESERRKLSCRAAVSLNNLFDIYTPAGTHAWARKLTPVDRVGRSIWIFRMEPGR
ncbi:MAG: glycosyltransferase family 39 protein [Bryobacteraceae bacterium]